MHNVKVCCFRGFSHPWTGCENLPTKLRTLASCTYKPELLDAMIHNMDDIQSGKGNFTFDNYCSWVTWFQKLETKIKFLLLNKKSANQWTRPFTKTFVSAFSACFQLCLPSSNLHFEQCRGMSLPAWLCENKHWISGGQSTTPGKAPKTKFRSFFFLFTDWSGDQGPIASNFKKRKIPVNPRRKMAASNSVFFLLTRLSLICWTPVQDPVTIIWRTPSRMAIPTQQATQVSLPVTSDSSLFSLEA